MNDIMFAFFLTLLAGLFTGIGGLISLFRRNNDSNFLAICLSFSAGVMLYISFVEIFAKALEMLESNFGDETGLLVTTAGFFGGIAFIALIDKMIPHENETATSLREPEDRKKLTQYDKNVLHRMGIMTALAIGIHNFPEGLVTFVAALQDPAMAITITLAIAIHNIPEGIAIAVPISYATGSKFKAIVASVASGLTEPLGAIVAYFLVLQWFGDALLGVVFAAVGGIMVYISVKQLLPTAHKYGEHSQVMKGLFAGMAVMAISLIVL